jgi:hypothetical protein
MLEPMRRSLALGVVAATALAAGGYALWPRHSLSPEDQVRAAVRQMEEGLGSKDVAKVLDQVSEAFHSQTLGNRTELRQLILADVLRGGGFKVVTVQSDVAAEPDGRLRWQGRVAAARAGSGGLATITDAELRQFQVAALFAEEQGHWRLVEASVTPTD